MSVKILGTGSFLPEKSVSNDDLSKVMDTSDEWISSRTGIRSRHISIEDTTSTMAVKAAKKALENAGVSAEELDHIFVATLSGDHATPSTSCQVQKGIGAVNAVCMDINAACSGFVYGLNTAIAYARAGMGKKMMIIGVIEALVYYLEMEQDVRSSKRMIQEKFTLMQGLMEQKEMS